MIYYIDDNNFCVMEIKIKLQRAPHDNKASYNILSLCYFQEIFNGAIAWF